MNSELGESTPAPHKLQLLLFGGFCLCDHKGIDIYIASKKGRAIIAMLAIAPNGERSRSWIQKQLWSRGSAQDSLRKELSKLRALFSSSSLSNPLPKKIPRDLIRLDINQFNIDLFNREKKLRGVFLEGLHIPHEKKFQEWLHENRINFKSLEDPQFNKGSKNKKPEAGFHPEIIRHASPARLCIALSPIASNVQFDNKTLNSSFFDDILDRIGQLLLCSGGIDLVDNRLAIQTPGLLDASTSLNPQGQLVLKVSNNDSALILSVQLLLTRSMQILCSRRCEISISQVLNRHMGNDPLRGFITETVDEVLYCLTRSESTQLNDGHSSLRLVHEAIDSMFQLSYNGLDKARHGLEIASEVHQDSVIYAWRAYLTSHYIDDPRTTDYQQYRDEARYLAARALEIDRYNPLTLSLLTHVHAFTLQDLNKARELISQAKSISYDHVMTHDAEALLNLYMGNLEQSRQSALVAAKLGRFLSFRYCFMTSLCMINGLSGDHLSAIEAGEQALILQPDGAERPFSPTIRYLAANYAKIGKQAKADKLLELLRQSHESLGQNTYSKVDHLAPSLEIADFLRIGQQTLSS